MFFVHEHQHGNQQTMRKYLDWEKRLAAQIAHDGDVQFRLSQRSKPPQAAP